MAYTKFDPDKTEFRVIAIKYNGNINAIAQACNVSPETIYQYFKRDPEGKKIIDDVRGLNDDCILDSAEYVMRYNLVNYKNSPSLAQRAAEYVLHKKGHMRNWIDSEKHKEEASAEISGLYTDVMSQISKVQSSCNMEYNSNRAEQKSE